MAEVIIMPKLGFNMDEGELVKWHKQVGDSVTKGEVLFEINTDKTTMPVEAASDGTLLKIMLQEGAFADVFTPIAIVGNPGEDPEAALKAFAAGGETSTAAEGTSSEADKDAAQAENLAVGPGHSTTTASKEAIESLKLTPKAKKLIKEEGIDVASLLSIQGTGYQGGITAKDIKASPLARKLAEVKGINLETVNGTGTAGKILKADVLAAAGEAELGANAAPDSCKETAGMCQKVSGTLEIASRAPYKGIRKVIGEKLSQSKFTAPHLYFTDSVDTTELTAFRKRLNETGDIKIAVSDLLTMAACKALKKYPQVNVSLKDDEILTYRSINIGTAVAGEKGLIVPVVKNVQNKSLTDVALENRDLVQRAKEGKLTAEEYSEGTFSISNLGMFGIGNFTAIINAPEAAILSVSSVRKAPVVVTNEDGEDTIAIRPMMNIQLSVDHRLIDGLLASQFVEYMKELLENPIRILM